MNTFPHKVSELDESGLAPYTHVGGNDTGWLNSDDTPLNAENLNKSDHALYDLLSQTDGYVYRIISTLNLEIEAREKDDGTLANRISTEANTRFDADTQLQTNITNEATERQNKDSELQTKLNTEKQERVLADGILLSDIQSEKENRQKDVSNIYSEILKLSASITDSIDKLKSLLEGADKSIKTDLQKEIDRATEQESKILDSAIFDNDSILITCGSSTENI